MIDINPKPSPWISLAITTAVPSKALKVTECQATILAARLECAVGGGPIWLASRLVQRIERVEPSWLLASFGAEALRTMNASLPTFSLISTC